MQKLLVVTLCASLMLTACAQSIRNHGFVPPQAELDGIVVNVDTRDAVIDLIGPPNFDGVGPDNAIYYVASKWRYLGVAKPKPVEREIVAIMFNGDDTVKDIARLGLQDGQYVVLNRRVSDGGANDLSIIRQIFGALGNFNSAAAFGGT